MVDIRRITFGIKLIVASILFVALLTSAFAEPEAVESNEITNGTAETKTGESAGSVEAQGGNVTEINITQVTQTGLWQGFWGSIDFELRLEDASNNSFYNWSVQNVSSGEIYFSNNSLIVWNHDWLNGSDLNVSYTQVEENWANSTNVDNLTNTYQLSAGHQEFNLTLSDDTIRQINESTAHAVNLQGGIYNNTMLWNENLLLPLWVSLINPDATSFNGEEADFQVLLPVRGDQAVETYYAYIELT